MAVEIPFPLLPTLALAGTFCWAVYTLIVFPLFLHPLRHIPSAHWSIPLFGDTWILYQRWRCRNNAITLAAHQRYGEVVRLGRNELSVNCVDHGIKTVYGQGWEKHAWYPRQFASHGVINMFSTLEHTPHSQKKRTMANLYSKSFLASSPQIADTSRTLLSTRFLPLLQSLSESGEAADVHELNNCFTMDFMSAYQFGLKNSTNFTQNVEVRRNIFYHYHLRRDYEFYVAELPWLKPLCRKFGLSLVPEVLDSANEIIQEWQKNLCIATDKYLTQLSGASHESPADDPVVYKQFKTGLMNLRNKDPAGARAASDPAKFSSSTSLETIVNQEIYSEMLDQLGAGHETSAIALTYLYWEMSKHPDMQERLRAEIATLPTSIPWPPPASQIEIQLPSPKDVDALPYLDSVLQEVLRVHTSIPGMQPRVSPATLDSRGHRLGPYENIPGGVRVSSMPYTLHRNPDVFPRPNSFEPERWLPSHTSEDQLKEMRRWFWAFGSGGRMCIGSHLAIQEIKLLVCAIYQNWRTEIVDDEGIEEIDAYQTRPRSNKLMLRFIHV
jgi:hypothetical protein